jgi:hypothetical protein
MQGVGRVLWENINCYGLNQLGYRSTVWFRLAMLVEHAFIECDIMR